MDEVHYSETNKNENYVLHATVQRLQQGSHYFKKCFMVHMVNFHKTHKYSTALCAHLLCQILQSIQRMCKVWREIPGQVMAQLVGAKCYKLEGHKFDSWWCQWNFSLTQSFWMHYRLGVNSASNRDEYQEYFLGGKGSQCIQLTNLLPSCAECNDIWEPQPPGTLRACPGLYRDYFTYYRHKLIFTPK